jgi:hypothetical protein
MTVTVNYVGDGTTASLTVPAQSATGSYIKADGTTATFTLANVSSDTFSITEDVAVDGTSFPTLNVEIANLYDAFIAGVGNSDMLSLGAYGVELTTTLPLKDAPGDSDTATTVTTFQGIVELVASTPVDRVTGTSLAEDITIGATGGIVNGKGGADIITLASTGSAVDYVVLSSALGSTTEAGAAAVHNFTDGTDKFALDGLTASQLTVAAASDNAAASVISITASGEYLMYVTGVAASALSPLGIDYMLVADIA